MPKLCLQSLVSDQLFVHFYFCRFSLISLIVQFLVFWESDTKNMEFGTRRPWIKSLFIHSFKTFIKQSNIYQALFWAHSKKQNRYGPCSQTDIGRSSQTHLMLWRGAGPYDSEPYKAAQPRLFTPRPEGWDRAIQGSQCRGRGRFQVDIMDKDLRWQNHANFEEPKKVTIYRGKRERMVSNILERK